MTEAKEFRKPYFCESENKDKLKHVSISIWCYRGAVPEPRWKDVDAGAFSSFPAGSSSFFLPADVTMDTDNYAKICSIEVDLSHISLIPRYKGNGERGQYFRLDYDLVLLFGLTELKAQVAWKEGVRVVHPLLDFIFLRLTFDFVFFLCGRALRNGKPRVDVLLRECAC